MTSRSVKWTGASCEVIAGNRSSRVLKQDTPPGLSRWRTKVRLFKDFQDESQESTPDIILHVISL